MKKAGRNLKKIYVIILFLAVMGSGLTATYAWFSSNSVVETDIASGRTSTDLVELLISSDGGNAFNGSTQAAIIRVNPNSGERLMPVSTADLSSFVYSDGTVESNAVHFTRVDGEKYYYHGRVFLKAVSQGHDENAKLQLYLDQAETQNGSFFKNIQGYVANAARLGMTFNGAEPKIFKVSNNSNPDADRRMNTVLNGVVLQENQVIALNGDTMNAVADPSQAMENYMVGADGMPLNGTAKPLLTMEVNRVYAVDIYFYLEGCDPDCTEAVQMNELDFHLAFYGVLE